MNEEKALKHPMADMPEYMIQAATWAEDVTCYHLLRPSGKV